MEANRKWKSVVNSSLAGTRAGVPALFQLISVASLARMGNQSPCPLREPLETGVDTHTVPLGAARVESLNRYLKSLRNKRKKHRKSSAKRAREKDRCRKMKNEYLALDWGRETSLKSNLNSLRESPTNDKKRKKERGGAGRGCMSMCVYVYVCV